MYLLSKILYELAWRREIKSKNHKKKDVQTPAVFHLHDESKDIECLFIFVRFYVRIMFSFISDWTFALGLM